MPPVWPRWLQTPRHSSLEDPTTPRTVHVLGLALLAVLPIPVVHNAVQGLHAAALVLAIEAVLGLIVVVINRLGATHVAARLLCLSTWALVPALCLVGSRGSHDEVLLGLPVVLVVAALLVDRRFFAFLVVLSVATVMGLQTAEIRGWFVNRMSAFTDVSSMVDHVLIILLTAVVVWFVGDDLRRALARARRNEAALAASKADTEYHAEASRRSEARFRTAMKLAAEGIVLGSPENRIADVNSEICEITGYSYNEIVGRDPATFILSEDLVRTPLRWLDLDEGKVVTSERRIVRRDGDLRIVESKSQRLPDGTLQCFVRDITRRRELEEQLRQSQKMEAVGTLAGGVAHDFNNMLTAMRGLIGRIEGESTNPLVVQEAMEELRQISSRATDLTGRLLAFARRQPLRKAGIDLRELVDSLDSDIKEFVGEHVRVAVEPAAEPCTVLADGALVSQVVMNLVMNARDAMPDEGRLELRTEVREVAQLPPAMRRAARPGLFVCLVVRDNGAGMKPDVRARAFEPFFSTKAPERGKGLGLSVVLGITEQHGGWVELDSQPGQGTEVRVLLPFYDGKPVPIAREPASAGGRQGMAALRGRECVLLVEDDESVRRIAATGLRHLGYDVREAASGPEALGFLGSSVGGIGILLTDMVMPGGMSGLELAIELRSRRSDLPVVITSGYSQETTQLERLTSLGMHFMAKPYELPTMARLVRAAIDGQGAVVKPGG